MLTALLKYFVHTFGFSDGKTIPCICIKEVPTKSTSCFAREMQQRKYNKKQYVFMYINAYMCVCVCACACM